MFAGAALHCSARTQPTPVASTAEAEATALHSGSKALQVYKHLHDAHIIHPHSLLHLGVVPLRDVTILGQGGSHPRALQLHRIKSTYLFFP